jgi:hypothetical protein
MDVVKDRPGLVVAEAEVRTGALAPTAVGMPAATVNADTKSPTTSDALIRMYPPQVPIKRLLKESPEALCIVVDDTAKNFSTEV